MHAAITEHSCQALQGLGCFGKDHNPAYRPVEAVGDTHEYLSWLGVALGNESLKRFAQGLVSGLVSLHYFACPLVENEQVVVLENYPGGDVFVSFLWEGAVHHGANIVTFCHK